MKIVQYFLLVIHVVVIVVMNIMAIIPFFILIHIRLNARGKNWRAVYGTYGPFVILPNHTNQWDPFILCHLIPKPIHWVGSDGVFRDSKLKPLMFAAGAIAKLKAQPDIATIYKIKRAITMRHVVGIFPEGKQTWDGSTMPILEESTAKLVRFLKVPVVVPLIRGGFLSKPRWAWKVRKCRIEVEFKRVISAQEVKTMRLSEIRKRLVQSIVHDEFEWQKKTKVSISGNKRAEHLEVAHYMCPGCRSIGTLISSGNDVNCKCGFTLHVDIYGFFVYPENSLSFNKPGDWVAWQNSQLVEMLQVALQSEPDPVLLQDGNVTLMYAQKSMKMKSLHTGEARLYKNRIEIGDVDNRGQRFLLNEISGINTFKQQKFEFSWQKNLYRFAMPNRHVSGYKWEVAVRWLAENNI